MYGRMKGREAPLRPERLYGWLAEFDVAAGSCSLRKA
jgi:hypothetical protein